MDAKHSCLVIRPDERDWILGVNSPIQYKANLSSANWLPYIEFFERQLIADGDTDGCVCFSAQESFDAQVEFLIQSGKIPQPTLDLFTSLGYMDTGTDGKPHFHTSPRWLQIKTGNGYNGNAIKDAWDAMRKYGCLPWKDLPVTPDLTLDEYLLGITPAMENKAFQFLLAIGGSNAIQYHWVNNGTGNEQARINALVQAPLCDGVNVGSDWNLERPLPPPDGSNPGHCVMEYREVPLEADIYDHYLPNPKQLISYPIWYALQAVVTITPPLPAPLPPPNPTPVQTSNWLQRLVTWLSNILSTVQKGSEIKVGTDDYSFLMNYSLLKSRTFWTLVVTFVVNGYAAVSGQIPAGTDVVINLVLTALASYFHLSTGNSVSGSN